MEDVRGTDLEEGTIITFGMELVDKSTKTRLAQLLTGESTTGECGLDAGVSSEMTVFC